MNPLPITCLALTCLLGAVRAQDSQAPQGVRGAIHRPDGKPAAGARIYLINASTDALFPQLKAKARGEPMPPLAVARAGANGAFALAIPSAQRPSACELRVVCDGFPTLEMPAFAFRPGRWTDIGLQHLDRGYIVVGKVTAAEGDRTPVAGATVRIDRVREKQQTTPTPGREHGQVVAADGSGWFRCDSVPAGEIEITARANGYAWQTQRLTVRPDKQNRTTIALPAGAEIGGVVRDPDGGAIAGARIVVTAFSDPGRTESSRSDAEGRFVSVGLRRGAYTVKCTAPGYVAAQLRPIAAGQRDVRVVMEPLDAVRVVVTDKDGRPLSRYAVTIRKQTDGQKRLADAPIMQRQVRADVAGAATVPGVGPGAYLLEVRADGHCKAFSAPFDVRLGDTPPRIAVRLTEGGIIEGTVTDMDGKPLPGATVSTLPNQFEDNPFAAMFRSMIPFRITKTMAVTDASGKYRLTLLTPGTYQLKAECDDYITTHRKGHEVVDGDTTMAPTLALQRCSKIAGMVLVAGKPGAGVTVMIGQTPRPGAPASLTLERVETVTRPDGHYAFDVLFAPGNYTIMAARRGLTAEQKNAEYRKTGVQITIRAGRDVRHDIVIR